MFCVQWSASEAQLSSAHAPASLDLDRKEGAQLASLAAAAAAATMTLLARAAAANWGQNMNSIWRLALDYCGRHWRRRLLACYYCHYWKCTCRLSLEGGRWAKKWPLWYLEQAARLERLGGSTCTRPSVCAGPLAGRQANRSLAT